MFVKIHEKLKALYGDNLCLRLLELIPVAVILACYVRHACLTYEEPIEVSHHILVPGIFFGYLLLVAVFSRIAVVRFTALLPLRHLCGLQTSVPRGQAFPRRPA